MKIESIIEHCLEAHEGCVEGANWGERGVFYNPDGSRPKGIYILTFKEKDSPNDNASKIDRGGIYRLNLGVPKPAFLEMFGETPRRPAAGETISGDFDFQRLDTITPHPVYGWMSWLAVLNPSAETFETLKPLIGQTYTLAKRKWRK